MKKLKRFTISLFTLLMFSGAAVVLPAAAMDSTGSTDTTSNTNNSQSESNQGKSLAEQFKQMAKDKIATERQNHQEQSQAHRMKACEARSASLTRRMSNSVAFANRHKAVFDKIYTRVKDFYVSKKLNVSNYDTLTAAVDSAQADAQSNIDALQSLDVSVDCASQTVADSVSSFQQAVKSTRDSLKAYRAALVDLINSLKGASTSTGNASNTNSTSNQ